MYKKCMRMIAVLLSVAAVVMTGVPVQAAEVCGSTQTALVTTQVLQIAPAAQLTLDTGISGTAVFNTAKKKSIPEKKTAFLKDKRFKNGAPWAAKKTPILSPAKGTGCYAYAADYVKYVYGKNAPTAGKKFTSANNIRGGDIIKVVNSQHWIVVLERKGNKLKTAEGNWGGKVRVSSTAYTINKKGKLCLNGKVFRTFSAGWHFE